MKPLATSHDAGHSQAPKAARAKHHRVEALLPLKASIALPAVGVTVSFSPQAIDAAARVAHGAIKLGSEAAELIADAADAIGEGASTVVEGGVAAAIVGSAILGALG